MSTEAGATRRRAKEGFAVNGSSEDFLDGMKVQCPMAKSRDCNVCFRIVVAVASVLFHICKTGRSSLARLLLHQALSKLALSRYTDGVDPAIK